MGVRRLTVACLVALSLGGCAGALVATQEDGQAPLESGGFRQWKLSGTYKGDRIETYLLLRAQGAGGKLRVCGAMLYDDTAANLIRWPELMKDVNSYLEIKREGNRGDVRVSAATLAQIWHHFGAGPPQTPLPKIVAHCVKTDVDWEAAFATAPIATHFQTTGQLTTHPSFPILIRR